MIVMSILIFLFFFFFFFTFSAFSPKFGKLFSEVSFPQGGCSAKWLFGEVVFGKVSALCYSLLELLTVPIFAIYGFNIKCYFVAARPVEV